MVAIHAKVRDAMNANIAKYHQRMACLNPIELSHDEALELMAPPEHLDILRGASKYADVASSESWTHLTIPTDLDGTRLPTIIVMMRTHAEKIPPLRPREPSWQEHVSCTEKVLTWATKALENARMQALTRYVMDHLADRCESGAQVRFLYPAVMHLCAPLENGEFNADKLQAWGQRNAEYKPQRSVPSLDKEFRYAMQETSAWLTSAALLSKDLREGPEKEVVIRLYGSNAFSFAGNTLLRNNY